MTRHSRRTTRTTTAPSAPREILRAQHVAGAEKQFLVELRRAGASKKRGRSASNRYFAKLLCVLAVSACAVEPRVETPHRLERTEFRVYWDEPTVRDQGGERVIVCDALCDELTRTLALHVHQGRTDEPAQMLFFREDEVLRVESVGPVTRDKLQEVHLTMPSTDGPPGGGHTRREETELRQTEDMGLRGFVTWWLSEEQTITLMLTAVPT